MKGYAAFMAVALLAGIVIGANIDTINVERGRPLRVILVSDILSRQEILVPLGAAYYPRTVAERVPGIRTGGDVAFRLRYQLIVIPADSINELRQIMLSQAPPAILVNQGD